MTVPAYVLTLSCDSCGGQLQPVATGRPTSAGREIRAVARCPSCRIEHLLQVRLFTSTGRPVAAARRSPRKPA